MMLLPGSANHDDRRFPDGDTFDIHRSDGKPLTFGYGIHLCLGAALARLEGPGRPRRGPQPVPDLGGRHGPGQARPDLDRPGLGDAPGLHLVIPGATGDADAEGLMGLLDDKVAVITGAGSGMAKASVKVFVREGAKVVAADISGAEQDTAAEVGGDVLPVHCDVTQEADVEAADGRGRRGVRPGGRRAQRGRRRRRLRAHRPDHGVLRPADGRRPAGGDARA